MTPASVLRTHQEVFYRSSPSSGLECSRSLYADDYNLVRSMVLPCQRKKFSMTSRSVV